MQHKYFVDNSKELYFTQRPRVRIIEPGRCSQELLPMSLVLTQSKESHIFLGREYLLLGQQIYWVKQILDKADSSSGR